MVKELATTLVDLNASQRSIKDFIQETEPYTQAHGAAFYQRHRVEWIAFENHTAKKKTDPIKAAFQ